MIGNVSEKAFTNLPQLLLIVRLPVLTRSKLMFSNFNDFVSGSEEASPAAFLLSLGKKNHKDSRTARTAIMIGVNPAPLGSPGTSVTLVIGPIPEHCTI
jgi:hypothetical protein